MPFASSTPTRSQARRSALIVSAGLIAATLSLGGTVAAQAAPLATATVNAPTATADGQLTLTVDGFAANEPLTVTFDSSPLTTYPDSAYTQDTTDGLGQYVATVYVPSAATVGTHAITVTGATTGPAATAITLIAAPTSSVSPSTVALSAYLSTGVTVTFRNFTPNSTVSFGLGDQGSGGPVGSPVVVDLSGVATLHYVATAGTQYSTPGTYTFTAFNADGSLVAEPATLTVTADPAAAPAAPVAAPAAPVKHVASFTG
ncbi:hypothetical protein [Leifsonia sp. 2MCAF36]|uniref:hypothetical protein n=1 Tax=Leifsonia sp. 2MCAF36 TaxID=3232988 RepID=UPI003F9BC65B